MKRKFITLLLLCSLIVPAGTAGCSYDHHDSAQVMTEAPTEVTTGIQVPEETAAAAQAESETAESSAVDPPFIRMDYNDMEAWKGDLKNLRILKDHLYKFKKLDDNLGIDPDFVPSEKGMDTLYMSGSGQFSAPQLRTLKETITEIAPDRQIYVIDLRQESHALANEGIPISRYGLHDWINEGMTLDLVVADEEERFGSLPGTTIKVYTRKDETGINETELKIDSIMTEKELVESEGMHYLRVPIQDHTFPTPEEIDSFIEFYKSIDPDHAWLHFHCQGGKGRTGIMMILYDFIRNPDVPMEDVLVRQTMLGGGYPLYDEDSDDYRVPHYKIKIKMTPLLYQYVQENLDSGFETSWSEWLETHDTEAVSEDTSTT